MKRGRNTDLITVTRSTSMMNLYLGIHIFISLAVVWEGELSEGMMRDHFNTYLVKRAVVGKKLRVIREIWNFSDDLFSEQPILKHIYLLSR